jgi:coenzyme F420 hydrogenase subunit beta
LTGIRALDPDEAMKRRPDTIEEIVSRGLCLQCGTCLSACPPACIELQRDEMSSYVPVIDIDRCIKCGICVQVCPGIGVDFDGPDCSVPSGGCENNPYTGISSATYIGHAVDGALRSSSSSGGIVTALLHHLLQAGEIRGAVVVRGREGEPFLPDVRVVGSPAQLLDRAQSRYHPAALNTVLRDIGEPEDCALVGLPCHVHGLKKYLRHCTSGRNFALVIGLFCGINLRFDSLDFLARRSGRKVEDLTGVSYREGNWPGRAVLSFADGQRIPVDKNLANHLYAVPRCLYCIDHTNELADLSCGDAWLPELLNGKDGGWTAVIVRSERGRAALEAADSANSIRLVDCGLDRIIQSQYPMIVFKKKNVWLRMRLAGLMGKGLPSYPGGRIEKRLNFFYLLGNIILSMANAAMQKKWFRQRAPGAPLWILKLYRTAILKLLYTDRHLCRTVRKIFGRPASGGGVER